MIFSKKGDKREGDSECNVLLRNKPDKGAVIPLGIILGMISLFFFPLTIWSIQEGMMDTFEDFMIAFIFLGPLCYLIIVLAHSLFWELLGKETVYYTGTDIHIYQRVFLGRETAIPWKSVTNVFPYDEPLIYMALPTHDPTIRIDYMTRDRKNKKVYFGFHLTDKQREIVIHNIQEILLDHIPAENK